MIRLNSRQKKYKKIFLDKLERRIYVERNNTCPCGHPGDILVHKKDRYGIPLTTVMCKYCGLLRSDPYYNQKTLKNFYNLEYRGIYEEEGRPNQNFFNNQKKRGKFIYGYLKRNYFGTEISNKKIVEVGCSAGGTLAYFKDMGNNVFGCDYDSSYINYGQKKGLNLVTGGAERLNAVRNKVDIVILCHVLEHFSNLEGELKKIRLLVKKGGLIFIEVPGIYLIHRSYGGRLDDFLQNAHAYSFTLKSLSYVMGKYRFKLIHGDESVFAIFEKAKGIIYCKRESYKSILSYLRHTGKLRLLYFVEKKVYSAIEIFLSKIGLLDFTVNAVSKAKRTFSLPHA